MRQTTFTTRQLVLLPLFAGFGIVLKPVIAPVVNLLTDPLMVTGGSTAGGIYMAVLLLGKLFSGHRLGGTVIGFLQGVLALTLGVTGFHGVWAIPIYTAPGLVMDVLVPLIPWPPRRKLPLCCVAANLTGSLITNVLFFSLPSGAFFLMICLGILSGWLGGWLCATLLQKLEVLQRSGFYA